MRLSTPPPFLPSSRYRPCGAGGKVPSPNAETSARRRGRRHANARPSHCVGEKIDTLPGFSDRPRRAREKSPQLSRENCGLSPKNAQLSRKNSGILSPGPAPDNETAKAPNVNGRASAPECGPRCAVAGVQRATAPLRLHATRLWAAAGRRDPRQSALPHSKAGKGAQTLRSTGGNSRCGSAARGAIRICVPTLGDFQGAWSRETRRCHTGAHALSRRRTRRLS